MNLKHPYARKDFSKQTNPFPEAYVNAFLCEDALQALKRLPDNSVDMVITSPPYNFGKEYDTIDDEQEWEDFWHTLNTIFDECIRILKYGGRIAVNVMPKWSHYIPTHHLISEYFMKAGMIWRNEIIWNKNNYKKSTKTAWGSWKSPSSPFFKSQVEYIEVFSKGDIKHSGRSEDIDITAKEFQFWVNSMWAITPETRMMKRFNHPAMFPEELVERLLKMFTFQNDIVVDPFGGVGTMAFVAKRFNRKYLSIDISEEYTQKAIDRMGKSFEDLGFF